MTNRFSNSTPTWEEIASTLPRSATDTDRLMSAVYYRFQDEGVDTTDLNTITDEHFRRARWSQPSNLAATANHCASKGWLSEAGRDNGRKLWRITKKGYDYIEFKISHNGKE